MVDLDRMEIERVTRAYDGGEIDRDVGTSVGDLDDGRRPPDRVHVGGLQPLPRRRNEEADAFVASEPTSAAAAMPARCEPPFADVTPQEDAARAGSGAAGEHAPRHGRRVRVTVRGAAGRPLALTARARVRAGRRRAAATDRKRARRRVGKAGRVTLVLRPAARYRRYLRRARRLRSRLEVRFSPAGGGHALIARRTVSFTA